MAMGKSLMSAYRRIVREVTRRIAKLEREGYIIPEKMKPQLKPITRPGDIRKEIERLGKYKESYIKRSKGVTYKTREGKIVKGEVGEERQRSERAKKGWRERKEKEEKKKLGQALYDAIEIEAKTGLSEASNIYDPDAKSGYTRRCVLILSNLEIELYYDEEGLYQRLGEANASRAVEDTQLACRYGAAQTEAEAWNACLRVLEIIRGKVFTALELQDIGDTDLEDNFEEY